MDIAIGSKALGCFSDGKFISTSAASDLKEPHRKVLYIIGYQRLLVNMLILIRTGYRQE
jgi:hypothetical protein